MLYCRSFSSARLVCARETERRSGPGEGKRAEREWERQSRTVRCNEPQRGPRGPQARTTKNTPSDPAPPQDLSDEPALAFKRPLSRSRLSAPRLFTRRKRTALRCFRDASLCYLHLFECVRRERISKRSGVQIFVSSVEPARGVLLQRTTTAGRRGEEGEQAERKRRAEGGRVRPMALARTT